MSTEIAPTPLLRLHPADDVAVARTAIAAGTVLAGPDGRLRALDDVPAGHKIALRAIAAGAAVRKYGQVIGAASTGIEAGRHVHVHNLDMGDAHPAHDVGLDYVPTTPMAEPATLAGT